MCGSIHQRLELFLWHMQSLSKWVERQGRKKPLRILAIGHADFSHSLVWGLALENLPEMVETDMWHLPLDHAHRGSGIILASTSTRPAPVRRLFSRVPTRRSLVSSKEPINRVLHCLRAFWSVIEPLSDWTLKYISTNCTQPPGFKTLSNHLSAW